jgi:hypothetical protein
MISSFFPFNHEVNWWPDLNTLQKKDSLEKANLYLKKVNSQIVFSYNSLKKNCVVQNPDNEKLSKQDSLLSLKIQVLEEANSNLKKKLLETNNTKSKINGINTLIDHNINTKPVEMDKNVLLLLKQDLVKCQEENLDMKNKLNKIKKLNELLKEAEKYNL